MPRNRETIAKHLYVLQARRSSKMLLLLTTIFFLSSVAEVYALDDLKLECDGTFNREQNVLPADPGAPIHFTVHLAATELKLELLGPLLFTDSTKSIGKETFVNGPCSIYVGGLCISKVRVDDETIDAERLNSESWPSENSGFSDWALLYINRKSGDFSFYHNHTWRKYPTEYMDEKIDAKCAVLGK